MTVIGASISLSGGGGGGGAEIDSFSPTSGRAGDVVTITGSGFTGVDTVTFGSVAATSFTLVSDTEIQATVPAGAGAGPITLGYESSADFTATTYRAVVLADSPVAYWRLGESSGTSAIDETGNGHTGTYSGASLGQVGLLGGDSDTAVLLAGGTTNSNISIPTSLLNLPLATSPLSLECWVKGTDADGGNFFSGRQSPFSSGTILNFLFDSSGHPGLFIKTSTTFFNPTPVAVNVFDGAKHHLVAVRDSSKNWTIYIDGVAHAMGNDGRGAITGTTDAHIGWDAAFSANSSQTMAATIDECAIYDVALTGTQVAAHYSAGA